MDNNGQRNTGGKETHLEQSGANYHQQTHGCNAVPMDINATHAGNMAYMMPPIPMEKNNPMYDDGMGMYYAAPPYQMYDNVPYGGNVMPYMLPGMHMVSPYEQYQPRSMSIPLPTYTPRPVYQDMGQSRVPPAQMVGRGVHRKNKNFLCC
ncbi:uncharacterized protein BBOV_IV001565 [Babesia bovis T2Bo]|uniref:uncharacterized protein n=1 Tax=Babesia bovis T2Bo TaxID=484906 RepID=UPI001D294873|nr:uncharacterized protein BBOV_IV001565 [Babesia bovis T2Bo]KAG6439894.1 hypothetical protein BBOV_IV001565 [Babesia bovis T2Bo]